MLLAAAQGIFQLRQAGQVAVDRRGVQDLGLGQGGLGVDDVGRGGVAVVIFDQRQPQVFGRLPGGHFAQTNSLQVGGDRLIADADLQRNLVQHDLQAGRCGDDLRGAAADFVLMLSAGVDRLIDVDPGSFDPGVERAGRIDP